MNRATLLIWLFALICGSALAQTAQTAKEGERPVRPDIASNAAIGGWCDALTGAKKEECLRDERRREQQARKEEPRAGGSCDALFGAEREQCLQKANGAARIVREH
jgi:hypothetical protein